MGTLALIFKEACYRRLNSLLVLLALVTTVGLPVAFYTAGHASLRETTRLMRDIGYNLRIIPRGTDMERLWTTGYSDLTMDDQGVRKFRERGDLSYNHLIAILQRRVEWRGHSVLMTGIASEVTPRGKKQSSMGFVVERGAVVVGYETARRLELKEGNSTEFLGKEFEVARCLAESGSQDDVRVYMDLAEAQELLELPGRINEIKALECYCRDPKVDSLAKLRQELSEILPDAQVLRMQAMAVARKKQRRMAEDYFAVLLPMVMLASALWIALLTVLNVRDRRVEIGILRALGHGSKRIAWLFLGKSILLGLVAAFVGFAIGTGAAHGFDVFETSAGQVQTQWLLLPIFLILAPVFAAIASLVPTLMAVTDDPAISLRESQ